MPRTQLFDITKEWKENYKDTINPNKKPALRNYKMVNMVGKTSNRVFVLNNRS